MKIRVTKIRRQVGGRARMRGPLLLVILFCAGVSGFAQGVPATGEITSDVADRLRRELNGSTEQKRSALFEIRNLRSAVASSLAVPALQDSDEIVRATAASSVVFMPERDATRGLIPLLNDRAEFVRREAAYALGEVGDRSATIPLVGLMRRDKLIEVRAAAAVALGKIGDPSAIESLVVVLRSRPNEDLEFLRRSAARSIGQIAQITYTGKGTVITPQNFLPEKFKNLEPGDPAGSTFSAAVDTLITVLRSNSEADDTRREAAYALGAIGDRRAVPVLQTYATSPDTYLAEIVKEALSKIERRNKISTSKN